MPKLLRNARAVLPSKTIANASVLIEDGRIARITESSSDQSPDADSVIDLSGMTLFPGFIDVHTHGAVGIDMMSASADGLSRVSAFLATQGVTAWLPTLVPAAQHEYEKAIRAITESMAQVSTGDAVKDHRLESGPWARVLGVHYEGPFVNSEQCGALHREYFKTFETPASLAVLPWVKHRGAVHMMTLAPEVPGGIELIRELTERNWVVSIGHTRATSDVLDRALAAGARHMTHFMNAMTPLHHRTLGAVGWGLINDQVTCDMIADGIHLDREILKFILRNKGPERVSLISDAIAAAGKGDGQYEIWGETITVIDGRTQNARGTIAGSVITMLDAVRMMMSLGSAESAVARMASQNPAHLLGIDYDCGSIAEGKRADLSALDEKLDVRLTIIGGEIVQKGV